MAKDREGSVNIYGAMQAKTAQGIVAYTDGIAHEKEDGTVINLDEMLKNGVGGGSAIVDVEELVYPGWNGTTVPNSGYVEKVYFNTNLSVDEVLSIIESANIELFGGMAYFPLMIEGQEEMIQLMYMNGMAMIITSAGRVFSSSEETGAGFVGWNSEFNGVISYNANALPTYEEDGETFEIVGVSNDKLSSLFSTTPFVKGEEPKDDVFYRVEKQGGVEIPNTGYVEKVYLNTSLSDEDVEKILLSLEYQNYIICSNSDLTNAIMVSMPEISGQRMIAMACGNMITNEVVVIYANQSAIDAGMPGVTSPGWQTFDNPYELNVECISEMDGEIVGDKNNLLTNLISLTPNFGESKSELYTYKNGEYKKVLQEGDNSSSSENVGKEIVDLGTITATSVDETIKIQDRKINITEEQYNKLDSKNVIVKLMVSVVDGTQFIKKEVYFNYNGYYHMNLYSESKRIYYSSIIDASGNALETIIAETDGTEYWVTYNAVELIAYKTNEVSTTSTAVVTSLGVANALKNYPKTTEVNQMIADYITTNFENGDEGSY